MTFTSCHSAQPATAASKRKLQYRPNFLPRCCPLTPPSPAEVAEFGSEGTAFLSTPSIFFSLDEDLRTKCKVFDVRRHFAYKLLLQRFSHRQWKVALLCLLCYFCVRVGGGRAIVSWVPVKPCRCRYQEHRSLFLYFLNLSSRPDFGPALLFVARVDG